MRKRTEYRYNPLDFKKDIAIGLTLPLTNDESSYDSYSKNNSSEESNLETPPTNSSDKSDTQGDFHLSYTTLEQAKSNLRNLVLTNQGERLMHPEFGCDVWKSLFENNTDSLRQDIKKKIQKQIEIWLPYINLLEVKISKPEGNENRMDIGLDFALFDNTMDKETIAITIGEL